MKRILARFIITAASLALIAGVLAYTMLSKSLPRLDGEFVTKGITADVNIQRDAGGIPVITAENRVDLAYGTGFVHGQDRFFQMDLTRRNAAGELAELFGPDALGIDRRHRFHRFRTRANAVVSALSDEEHEIVQAYADGVNAGLTSSAQSLSSTF